MPDYERLQGTLDDIAGTVDWAAGWLEYLETEEVRVGTSDLEVLKAELTRLRLVADSLVPGRVRDPETGRRWYLAPDEAKPRELALEAALERADAEVDHALDHVVKQREEEDRHEVERKEERQRGDEERQQRQQQEQERVRQFLTEHGASTTKEIAAGTGLNSFAADQAAKAVAKRGKGQRFTVTQ
jgi:hypothetical protein